MKKFTTLAVAALAAGAVSASTASAVTVSQPLSCSGNIAAACALVGASDFGGFGGGHQDNLASPTYLTHFGSSGTGDSHYCFSPGTADNDCSADVIRGVVAIDTTGWLNLTNINPALCAGCGHGATSPGTGGFWGQVSVAGGAVVVNEGLQGPLP